MEQAQPIHGMVRRQSDGQWKKGGPGGRPIVVRERGRNRPRLYVGPQTGLLFLQHGPEHGQSALGARDEIMAIERTTLWSVSSSQCVQSKSQSQSISRQIFRVSSNVAFLDWILFRFCLAWTFCRRHCLFSDECEGENHATVVDVREIVDCCDIFVHCAELR